MKRSRNVQGLSLKARWGKQINSVLSTREQGEAAKPGRGGNSLSYLSSHPRTQVLNFMDVDGGVNQTHPPGHRFSNTIDSLANLVSCLYSSLHLISSFLPLRTQLRCHLLSEASLGSLTQNLWLLLLWSKAFISTHQGHIVTLSSSYVPVSPSRLGAPRGKSSTPLFSHLQHLVHVP